MTRETDRRGFMKATALTVAGAWGLAPILSSEASSINQESPSLSAVGDKGFVEMDPAFGYQGQRLFMKEGSSEEGNEQKFEIKLQPVNHFASEMDHLADCVLNNNQVRTPGEMGLADMRIIMALTDSLNGGGAAVAIRCYVQLQNAL
jgi:predicted dehydrogenase